MKRILVVDDDPDILFLYEKYLQAEGYDVVCEDSGPDALLAFSREVFDLVVADVMMPGMDGFEMSRILKKQAADRKVPIIFITARTDKEALTEGFKVGGSMHLSKPFNRQQLISAVSALIPAEDVA